MKYYYLIDSRYYEEKYRSEIVGLSKEMRAAWLFRKYLEEVPIFIEPDDLFAGWYGYDGELPKDLAAYNDKRGREWAESLRMNALNPDVRFVMNEKYGFCANGFDRGHNLIDYGKMLKRGLNAYIADVEKKLTTVPADSKEANYLSAMKASLTASGILSLRYAELAKKMAEKTEDEAEKARLVRIEAACRKVPMEPAEDFFEAIQSAYLLWSLNSISDSSWISVSFGSFDQFMYPYYLKSQKKGCSDKEAEDLLVEFYRKLDQFGGEAGGIDCNISVGGVDENGEDLTNELSYLIVSAEKKSLLRAPILSVRVNPNTPKKLMDEVISSQLFEIGQPTFYGEESCLKAMMATGLEEKEARKNMVHTCMQVGLPGELVESGWGCVTNLHLPLELVINGGKPLNGELPIELKTEPKTDYKSVEEIYVQYELYFRELFTHLKKWNLEDVENICLNNPNPWLSAATADCIERACDRWNGGARYHYIYVENFAFANAADALEAIEHLVFEENKYTMQELICAVQKNYMGYEEIRSAILKCPKYGMNEDRVDTKAKRLLQIVSKICEENNERNIRFMPCLHTLEEEVVRGANAGATLDGRLAGEPFNKNAGPANISRSAGPTAVALSACKLDQTRLLFGGQALDVHFAIRNMDTPENRRKIEAFLRTYFAGGGMQVQVNALSAATLKKAYDRPEEYKDLIVRIGGHSRYFYDLPNNVKLEFIERISIEEGTNL